MERTARSFDWQERGSQHLLGRFIELLLHAKGGAVSAIFVLGATGALVSATTHDGVTTVTVTETSPSPSTSVSPVTTSPKVNVSPSAPVSPALIPVSSPTTLTPGATPCGDEAHARRDAVRLVDRTASDLHVKLEHMRRDARTDTARKAVIDADRNIRDLRQAAVKAIHMTATESCTKDKDDDEDKDEDKDEDEDHNEHKDKHDDHQKANKPAANTPAANTPASVTLTGSDPKAIAQLAVTAMKAEFDKAKAAVDAQPAAGPRPKREGDRKDNSNKDKGNKGTND
jgi:hypothetical protein